MAHNRERHGAAVLSAGTPHSNRVRLQARGLFNVLFTCSPEVWVRVWTAVCLLRDPSIPPVTCPGCCPRRLELDISNSTNLNAAEAALQNRCCVDLMDANHGIGGEISKTHPAVCLIRTANIFHSLGYPGHMLNILSYSIITVIRMGVL